MQLKLEYVLKNKEKELKLHEKFLNLKRFLETTVFPLSKTHVKQHTEELKALVEKILPDPKDRTEEMFSGEIFILLCTIYLHDIGMLNDFGWSSRKNIIDSLEGSSKKMLLSYGICEKMDFPEIAIDIINYLIFSKEIKKIPAEWVIVENSRKAIIRNAGILARIFNFSHLIFDLFCSDLKYRQFRRFDEPHFIVRHRDTRVDIDSREGIISINYNAKSPYELHLIENVKTYTENAFNEFRGVVNGKIGFNYKSIVWNIKSDFNFERDVFDIPKFSPYNEFEGPPLERWEKASLILDKMFKFSYAIVVGDETTGKTTVMRSFIVPQLLLTSPNVFYCELWEKPVNDIKNIICKRYRQAGDAALDIVSLCNKLLQNGYPSFFILDNFDRYANIDESEREKLERFISFCLEKEDLYLIVSGDKEDFFDWYRPFDGRNISAICEIKPIECEILQSDLNTGNILMDVLNEAKDDYDLRRIVAVFADKNSRHLNRYTVENIFNETAVPYKTITGYLNLLKEKDILVEHDSGEQTYYVLSNRYLKKPLYRVLRLDDFEEKRKVRNMLQNLIVNETFLDVEALDLIEKWKNDLIFSKEEMGLVLSSAILHGKNYRDFFEKAKRDGRGLNIQPILKLLYNKDPDKRMKTIELLIEIQDKDMINPLLEHLKKEDVFEIKDLMIQGMGLAGKKRTIFAIMDTLKYIGDRKLKLRAIEFFYSLLNGNAKSILSEFREIEKDPIVLMKIDDLLSMIRGT